MATLLLLAGNLGTWTHLSIADTSNFVETTRDILGREDVREALATRIVDNLLQTRPILRAAVGNALISVVTGLLGSDSFQTILDGVATQLHQALILGERLSITIESRELQIVVLAVIRVLAPAQAGDLTFADGALRIELFSEADLPSYASEIAILRWGGIAAGIIGVFLVLVPIVVRRDRWSVGLAGLTLVTMSLLTYALVLLAGWIVAWQVADRQAQIVIAAIVDGFTTLLIVQTLVILSIGIVLCSYGFALWPWRRRPALQLS